MLTLILAQVQEQADVFGSIRKGFNGSNYDTVDIAIILLLLAGVAAIFVLFWMRRQQEKQENLNDPDRLFDELAAGHGLVTSQRELLAQLASTGAIRKPAILFVRADLFDHAAQNPTFQGEGVRQQIEILRRLLFGD